MINYEVKPHEAISAETLPVGAYVGQIIDAQIETVNSNGGTFDRLVLKLDVTEGPHAGHYQRLYESQSGGMYPARYKGIIRFTIPQKGGQYEAGQRKQLEHLAWCLEDSNRGFTWTGDETKLKALKIGFSVRERDWVMERDGAVSAGTTTEIGRVESVRKVAAGEVKPMKKRELRDADKAKLERFKQATAEALQTVEVDEDLPF